MITTRRNVIFALLFMLGAASLFPAAGCVTDARTSNQGGGSLLTAGNKLLDHQIGELTADEWQIVGDNLPVLAAEYGVNLQGYEIPMLTDEQAAAIVAFLADHNIRTIEELTTAIESGSITEADVPPELTSLL
jgi:hypothetical protein